MRLALVALGSVLALALGVVLGVAGDRALRDSPPRESVSGGGTLARVPAGPLMVRAESVRLPAGFSSRHVHGGPTFNTVVAGRVEIRDPRGTRRYGPGEFFFEPAELVHTIFVIDAARLDVVRLLPRGAEATTEVPES